jgi:hypothetical protein
MPEGVAGILAGVSAVFFAYIGFDAISTTAEECHDPQRDLPRGMMYSIIICTVLYVLIALVLTGMVNYKNLAVDDPLAFAFSEVGLNWISGIIAISAVVAMASVLLVFQMGQPRIWMSMSRDGLLPKRFSKVHPKAKPEIWAFGLRNPWTFSFDAKTGDLFIADIGQNHWEEINMQPASSKGGENYGWKFMCGSHPFPMILKKNADGTETSTDPEGFPKVGVPPIAEYSHVDQGICVINLGISRGTAYPELDGVYFAADWGSGKVWGMKQDGGKWQMQEMLDMADGLRPTGSGTGPDGTIYLTHATANYGGPVDPYTSERGALWKIVPTSKVAAGAVIAPLAAK